MSAGPWKVTDAVYTHRPEEARRVWVFKLEPADEKTRAILQSVFQDGVAAFEDVLRRFATVRTELYSNFAHILRARDSIAGHVGEYFAVKRFNKRFPERPLVRVRSNFKDLDAIQTGSGARYAVKTVTKATQTTSNIWTPLADLPRSIDAFLVLDLDPFALEPRGLFRLPVSKATRFWRTDRYQGAGKLSCRRGIQASGRGAVKDSGIAVVLAVDRRPRAAVRNRSGRACPVAKRASETRQESVLPRYSPSNVLPLRRPPSGSLGRLERPGLRHPRRLPRQSAATPLVLTRRVVPTWFDATREEQLAILDLVDR